MKTLEKKSTHEDVITTKKQKEELEAKLKGYVDKNNELNELLGRKNKENEDLVKRLKKKELKVEELFAILKEKDAKYSRYQRLNKDGFFTPRYIPEVVASVLRLNSSKEVVKMAEEQKFFNDCQKVIRVPRVKGAKHKYQTTVLFSPYGISELLGLIRKSWKNFLSHIDDTTDEEERELEQFYFASSRKPK